MKAAVLELACVVAPCRAVGAHTYAQTHARDEGAGDRKGTRKGARTIREVKCPLAVEAVVLLRAHELRKERGYTIAAGARGEARGRRLTLEPLYTPRSDMDPLRELLAGPI